MGKFLIFWRIQLKFRFWLYKKRRHTSWKFQLEITSKKKLLPKILWETYMKWTVLFFLFNIEWQVPSWSPSLAQHSNWIRNIENRVPVAEFSALYTRPLKKEALKQTVIFYRKPVFTSRYKENLITLRTFENATYT